MEGISYSKPEPFRVPEYDYEPVRAIVKATDLSSYYDNLLDDAAQRERDDFTYGIPPVSTKQLHEAAKTFDWKPWAERIRAMGDHYKVCDVSHELITRLKESIVAPVLLSIRPQLADAVGRD